MADHTDRDRTDRPAGGKVPPTPGFHLAPGKEADTGSHTTIPATPGFHAVPKPQGKGGENTPTAPTPTQRDRQPGRGEAAPKRPAQARPRPQAPSRPAPQGAPTARMPRASEPGGVPTEAAGRGPGQAPHAGARPAAPKRPAPGAGAGGVGVRKPTPPRPASAQPGPAGARPLTQASMKPVVPAPKPAVPAPEPKGAHKAPPKPVTPPAGTPRKPQTPPKGTPVPGAAPARACQDTPKAPAAEPKPAPKVKRIPRDVETPQVPAYRPPEGLDKAAPKAEAAKVAPEAPKAAAAPSGGATVAGTGATVSDRPHHDRVQTGHAGLTQGDLDRPAPGVPEPADTPKADTPKVAEPSTDAQPKATKTTASAREKLRAEQANRPTIGELFAQLSDQVQTLVKGEIALVKAKVQGLVSKMGTGVALLVVALVVALYMIGVALHAAVLGFSRVMPDWAAALTVAGILLLIVVICALTGVALIKKGLNSVPNPQENLKKDVDAMKKGITQ